MNPFYRTLLAAGLIANLAACATMAVGSAPANARKHSLARVGELSRPRSGHTATLLANGAVLIAGGMQRNGVYYESAELYLPSEGGFRPTAAMSSRRVGHTATLLPGGKVLIAGGFDGSGPLASAELYDPSTNAWAPTGSMTNGRAEFTATLLQNGRVLVVGGQAHKALAGAELYDPVSGQFSPTGSMAAARNQHSATLLGDGRVLIAGGGDYQAPLSSAEVYDPARGTFSATGSLSGPRYKHAAVALGDGEVVVLGGSDGRDSRGCYASAEVYDAGAGRFSPAGAMVLSRYKLPAAAVMLKDGRILIAGGADRIEVYDPAAEKFTLSGLQLGEGRFFSTATMLADGRVLIAGGYGDHFAATATAWLYS